MSPWCVMMPKNCGLTYRQPNSLVDVYIFNCCQRLLHQCWPHYGWAWLVTLFCHINKRWSRDAHCTHWLRSHFHKEFTLIAFVPLPLQCCILKPSKVKILLFETFFYKKLIWVLSQITNNIFMKNWQWLLLIIQPPRPSPPLR